jgi:GNAT superfamily N-acetyltransferase
VTPDHGPSGLGLQLVAPDGPATIEEWFAPLLSSDRADWPEDPGWFLHERVALLDQPGVRSYVLGVGRLDGAVVGCIQVGMPLIENTDSADIELYVDPASQHRGVGRALLAHAERIAAARGRIRLRATTDPPLHSPELGRRGRFARAAGYEPALEEARLDLELPVEPARLDGLEEDARRFAPGYRFVTWSGPCPPACEAGRLEVGRGMSADVPRGNLDAEPEEWDAARLRQSERLTAAMDLATVAVAAIAPAGTLVGFTQLGVPRATPSVAYQFDTAVLRAHRGHRLGLLLKLSNARALGEQFPSTRRIVTHNGVSNHPMRRINDLLGFRLTGTRTVWQKQLPRSPLRSAQA